MSDTSHDISATEGGHRRSHSSSTAMIPMATSRAIASSAAAGGSTSIDPYVPSNSCFRFFWSPPCSGPVLRLDALLLKSDYTSFRVLSPFVHTICRCHDSARTSQASRHCQDQSEKPGQRRSYQTSRHAREIALPVLLRPEWDCVSVIALLLACWPS